YVRIGGFLTRRLAPELQLEIHTGAAQLLPPLVYVNRDADRLGLVRDRALAGLADPPGRVGRELVALAPVELLDRPVQADDALLDQVQERHVMALVLPRDRDDEAEVRIDHALLGRAVAALDALRQLDLLGRGQQLVPSDLVQEELERVGRLRDAGHVNRILADVDAARLQLPAQLVELAVGQLVLARERLQLALLDLTALLDLLDECVRVNKQIQRSSSFPGH